MTDEKKGSLEREQPAPEPGTAEHRPEGAESPPLHPGKGPRAPRGDALLDGSGTRHGVDAADEVPGSEG